MMSTSMATPRSFRRTIRTAHLRLVYSTERTAQENLRSFEEVMHKVSASVPLPEEHEAPPVVVRREEEEDRTSVLSLPRRDRDPALVLQEINGCKSLLLEVIRRAAYDWVLYRTSRRMQYKMLAEQAFEWLFLEEPGSTYWRERASNEKHITSFVAICSALDLDPDSVREHVRRLTPKNVMSVGRPPEYRRREPVQHAREEAPVALGTADLESDWAPVESD